MGTITFLHAADIHLGRPFSGLLRSSPDLGRIVLGASYRAWQNMVRTAIDRRVGFVVLAGDTFHGSHPPVRALVAFREGVRDLYEAGIQTFMCLGNHDPLRTFPQSLRALPGLHVFGSQPEAKPWHGVEVDVGLKVFGVSFERSLVTENLVRSFTRDPGIDLAVGVAHTNVAGSTGHQNYAPCTLNDLRESGMDVWCLGHVHASRMLSADPLILYAGTSQAASMLEYGPRGCWHVTLSERGAANAEFVSLAPVLWEHVDVDVTDGEAAEDLVPAVEEACSRLVPQGELVEAILVRIHLKGARPGCLTGASLNAPDLMETLSERLLALPVPVFPEAVRDDTRSTKGPGNRIAEDGFLGDFARLCRDAAHDPDSISRLTAEIQAEISKTVGAGSMASGLRSVLAGHDRAGLTRLIDGAVDCALSTFDELAGSKG